MNISNPEISALQRERSELQRISSAEWLNTPQVARLLKISPSSLEKARSSGCGPYAPLSYHKLGRLVRYRRADVEAFLDAQRVTGVSR